MIFRLEPNVYINSVVAFLRDREPQVHVPDERMMSFAVEYEMGTKNTRLSSPLPGLDIYTGCTFEPPAMRINYTARGFQKKHFFIPDFHMREYVPMISERFWKLIQEFDDFPHQVWETQIFDRQGTVIHDRPMYFLNVRRAVHIEPDGSVFKWHRFEPKTPFVLNLRTHTMKRKGSTEEVPIQNEFLPRTSEEPKIATLQARSDIRDVVEGFPIWRWHQHPGDRLYMNKDLFDACQAEGITGLVLYKRLVSSDRWNVSHV
ncbi:MAG: hypothetical protein RIM33_02915 [Alphaproteobacteria bacterium]